MRSYEIVERAAKAIRDRGVSAELHVIRGSTHYGVYREGFAEARKVELAWFDKHLKSAPDTRTQPQH